MKTITTFASSRARLLRNCSCLRKPVISSVIAAQRPNKLLLGVARPKRSLQSGTCNNGNPGVVGSSSFI